VSCEETRSRIEEARLGLLRGPALERYEAHLESCADCAREAREAAALETLLDAAREPDRDRAVAKAIAARVRGRRRMRWIGVSVLGAAACALVLAALLGGRPDLPFEEPVALEAGERATLSGVELTALGAARLTAAGERVVRLERGAVRFSVTPGHGAFAVITGNGRIDVKGTEFEVRVMTKGQVAAGSAVVAVLVITGAVVFTNEEGSVPVRANEIVVALPGKPPRRFTPEDVAKLLEDNARLKSDVSRLTEELASAASTAVAPESEPPATEPGEKPPEGVPASVAETDWEKLGKAVARILEFEKEPNAEPDPESLMAVAYFMDRLSAMAKELGYDDPQEVLYDPKVLPRFLRAIAAALLPDLPPETVDKLSADFARLVEEKSAGLPEDLLPLEKFLRDTEIAADAVSGLRGHLPEEQIEVLVPLLDAQTLAGFSTYSSTSTSIADLRKSVKEQYRERLKLDEAEAALAGPVLDAFVSSHLDTRKRLTSEHGRDLAPAALQIGGREKPLDPPADRVDLLRVRAALLKEQTAAEREIYELLDDEGKQRVLGAGVTIWLLGDGK
jgi:hypothetical protein